jgi:hypothetical protein
MTFWPSRDGATADEVERNGIGIAKWSISSKRFDRCDFLA